MASYQQLNYCKNCKKNVSLNSKGQCAICFSTQTRKTWSVRFRYIDEEGNEVHKRLTGFGTKKEAQEAEFKFFTTHKRDNKKIDNLSFPQLYNEFEQYFSQRVKKSTHYDFVSKCQSHIYPYFEKFNVKDIKPKDILLWQNSIESFSYNYKCHLRTCLSSMLKYAERYHDITNQLRKVDNFRNLEPKKEMNIWAPNEFYSVLENVKEPKYKTFFLALYLTGARKGEILATTWRDWDLKNETLNINKSISKKVTGATYAILTPKNQSSNRKIKIPKKLVEEMSKLKESFDDLSGFAFGGKNPLPESCIGRKLTRAAQLADVKPIRVHDLRHSHASLLISKGVSIVAIAKRLGHSNIEQTLNTYAHMMPNEEDLLIKKLNEIA